MQFRKALILIGLMLLILSGFMALVHMVVFPESYKEEVEPIDHALVRIYENFLHKTKYSYERILETGTNYDDQERVFIELTKQMIQLKKIDPVRYESVRKKLGIEIRKNEKAFEVFFQKISKMSPEEISDLVRSTTVKMKSHAETTNKRAL